MADQSARAKIMRFAQENQPAFDATYDPETGFAVDDPEAHLSSLLDDYAHDLAEKIRQHEYDPGEVGPVHLAFQQAADVIDPRAD